MYDFSDDQCLILKAIEEDALKMNHTAILNPSDVKGVVGIEQVLQSFVRDGLFWSFKPLDNKDQFSDEELEYIREVYGESVFGDAISHDGRYFIFLATTIEEDWDSIAKSVRAHDRIKLHNGLYYELKYDEHEGFLLRYYDYREGRQKDVIKVYDGTAIQAFVERCFKFPNSVIRLSDLKHTGSKNISQLVHDLKLPKPIRDLFFREVTRETVYFTPRVKENRSVVYDLETLSYLNNSKEI